MKHPLDSLIEDLGREEAVSFARFILPHLAERRDALLRLLAQENWREAAALAHKTLGTVRGYDDGVLEHLLDRIERQEITAIRQAIFQQNLQRTLDEVLAGIESWLHRKIRLKKPDHETWPG
ncbi:MAG: hypothetical protein KJ914_02520 [Gammaproteobacteria bacterium]|nr:hypothetical protein [Gammaproteobacteria bacterium]MBU1722595.1 hypothetical protein [Gammaproteobacteria bacterium]MBU2007067.1 hypothetical protein [Gammaproteobacteria bacterium]